MFISTCTVSEGLRVFFLGVAENSQELPRSRNSEKHARGEERNMSLAVTDVALFVTNPTGWRHGPKLTPSVRYRCRPLPLPTVAVTFTVTVTVTLTVTITVSVTVPVNVAVTATVTVAVTVTIRYHPLSTAAAPGDGSAQTPGR